jgi:hypothetical protein
MIVRDHVGHAQAHRFVVGCLAEVLRKIPTEIAEALEVSPLEVVIEPVTPIAGSWAVFSPPQASGANAEIILSGSACRLTFNRVCELLAHECVHAALFFAAPEVYAQDHEALVRQRVTEWGYGASARLIRRDY